MNAEAAALNMKNHEKYKEKVIYQAFLIIYLQIKDYVKKYASGDIIDGLIPNSQHSKKGGLDKKSEASELS